MKKKTLSQSVVFTLMPGIKTGVWSFIRSSRAKISDIKLIWNQFVHVEFVTLVKDRIGLGGRVTHFFLYFLLFHDRKKSYVSQIFRRLIRISLTHTKKYYIINSKTQLMILCRFLRMCTQDNGKNYGTGCIFWCDLF